MTIVKTLGKGQIVIPKQVRERHGIKPGTMFSLYEEDDRIVLVPVADDPIRALRGIAKGGPSLAQELVDERRADNEREEKEAARFIRRSRVARGRAGRPEG
ncbi:MAG: AbrB/MazE/SpoVT family DNA-binding domain-containing protein [Candidatus Latescibacterota bacterium]|nr:MAG: AbrB/MazE/SpoVT family DNA-binding domain-containing protein [Candidatus Latescibacterota bacterium]